MHKTQIFSTSSMACFLKTSGLTFGFERFLHVKKKTLNLFLPFEIEICAGFADPFLVGHHLLLHLVSPLCLLIHLGERREGVCWLLIISVPHEGRGRLFIYCSHEWRGFWRILFFVGLPRLLTKSL